MENYNVKIKKNSTATIAATFYNFYFYIVIFHFNS